ncbi:hypothetical protein [Streptomyces sp. NBC_01351]|uniref:hypothetical protein n=1 Tax=Streptomyces sp. NBC_01351 TaxID=2903833 RepID=UPI003FCD7AB4
MGEAEAFLFLGVFGVLGHDVEHREVAQERGEVLGAGGGTSGEYARAVAEALRHCFAGPEQRSYPGLDGDTRLHLTVDTATPAGPARPWLAASRTPVGAGAHSDET